MWVDGAAPGCARGTRAAMRRVHGSLRVPGSPGGCCSAAVPAALTPTPAGGTALHFVCVRVAECSGAEQLPG